MPSVSRLQRKRDELQRQYDLLSEKIHSLRSAYAIEAGEAVRFQLQKQIEQAESERDAIEQQIEALEAELALQTLEESPPSAYPQRGIHVWVVYALFAIGIGVTLFELLGLAFKGLRFLGGLPTSPGIVLAAVLAFTVLIWLACGYVSLKKQKDNRQWRQRAPAYGTLVRVVARMILLVNAVVTLTLLLSVLRYDVIHIQAVTKGLLGIVVAEFGEGVDIRASAHGRELSSFVARNLRREIELLPGLKDNVTIISGPLVRSEKDAQKAARESEVALVIWGWVSGDDTFVPSFTFVEPEEAEVGLKQVPVWYEVEISGGGTLELSETVAQRASGLIEYIVGLLYLNESVYDKAATEFQRAIDLTGETQKRSLTAHETRTVKRTLAIYHLVLGRTFAAQGRPDWARAEYERARECDPEYGPIYIGLGNIDYSAGRFMEALQWYEEAVRLVPESRKAAALYSRGNAHFSFGEYEAAAVDYALAIEGTEPDDKVLDLYRLVLGITLCRLNRFAEGLEKFALAQQLAEPHEGLHGDAEAERKSCEATATAVAQPLTPALSPAKMPIMVVTPTRFPTIALTPTLSPRPAPTHTPTPTPTNTPTPTHSPTSSQLIAIPDAVVNEYFSPGPRPAALAVAGDFLWLADDKHRLLYQLDRAGTPQISIPITVTGTIRGLTWDGEALYLALSDTSEENRIARLDTAGMVLQSFPLPVAPIGLGWDSDGSTLWTASEVSGEVFLLEFNTDGRLLQTLNTPVVGSANALTWAPDGVWLVYAFFGDWYRFSFAGEKLHSGDLPFGFWGDSALAWDERGYLWLVAKEDRQIYQFSLREEKVVRPTPMPELTLPRPQLEPVPPVDRAIVHVVNSLQGTLSLSFGDESDILAPGESWLEELNQGVYTVYASASMPEPIAFSSTELLVRGYEHTWSLARPD